MAKIIQYRSIMTGEWRDLVRLHPEADEGAWLTKFSRNFTNLRVRYIIAGGGAA